MNIVLLGIQGCGKGTLVNNLEKHIDFDLISVGKLLRDEVSTGSALGQHIKRVQLSGRLVEIAIVMDTLKKKLKSSTKKITIFDGFPRNIEQLHELDKICKVDKVIYLNLSKETAIERILNRLNCLKCGYITDKKSAKNLICPMCGAKLVTRFDDNIESVNTRFEQYFNETYPLIDIYRSRGVLFEIDASKTPDEILDDVLRVIE